MRRALPLSAAAWLLVAGLVVGCAEDVKLILGVEDTPRERVERATKVLAESHDPQARENAVIELGAVGTAEVVPALTRALRDPAPRVRLKAADRLGGMRGEALTQSAIPTLREALVVEQVGAVRVTMAWTLKKLKGEPRDWVPAFRSSLADPDQLTRYNAAVGLVGQGEAAEVFPVVFEAVGTEFGQRLIGASPRSVVSDLVETGDRRLIPLLLRGLERGNPDQRAVAALAIAAYDPVPAEAVPLLTALLRHPDARTRDGAALGLQRISMKAPARSAAPALAELLRDPDPGVRRSAAMALRLVDAPRVAVPALIQALGDPAVPVRDEAAFALGEMGRAAQDAVPPLIRLFREDPGVSTRVAACRALGKLAPRAREAIVVLEPALRDSDERIRDCAAASLGQIKGAR